MKFRFFAWLAAVALAAGACGQEPETPSAARQFLNLGLLINADLAKVPNGPARGVALAIDEYNSHRDSTYQVRLRRLVSDGSSGSATQSATRLAATERLIGVVGALSSGETAEAAPVFEKASIPFLATSPDAEVAAGSRTFRRLVAGARQEGEAMARYASRRVDAPAIVFHDGSTSGEAFTDGAKQALEAAKRPVQSSQRISAKTDLVGVLGSVPQDAPAFVLFGGEGNLGANFADVLRKGQFQGPVVASHQIMESRPTAAPEGVLAASVVAVAADPQLRSFARNFSAKFKAAPGPLAVESYEGAYMVLEAVEEVEPKPRDIVDFLQLSRSFLGDSKSYEYDEHGELRSPPVWVYQSKSGEWTFAGRSDTRSRGSRRSD